jgi:exonuclease VII large subunit
MTHVGLATWPGHLLPDAIVIIRGAVNDLAWLNDCELARFICLSSVLVSTGVGLERDSTVLDKWHTSGSTRRARSSPVSGR